MKAKNELLQFVAGVVMLVVGLYIFSQKVIVSSGFFGGGLTIGGFRMNSGLIIVPLIAGIVWMFVSDAFGAKVLTVFGVLIIIVSIIMSTSIHLATMTLYEWVLILVLIFGGAGFVAKVLFASNGSSRGRKKEQETKDVEAIEVKTSADYVEEEIQKIRDERDDK